MNNSRYGIRLILIAGIVAFLYVTGIPSIYVCSIPVVKDIEPVYIMLLANMILAILVGSILVKVFIPNDELDRNEHCNY